MERRPYTCPEEILPTRFSPWAVAPFVLILSLGVVLDVFLHIQYATIIAASFVFVSAWVMAAVIKRNKLSTFPCSNCGATSLEQSEDEENILLICHSCQIIWVTNLTIGGQDTEYTDL